MGGGGHTKIHICIANKLSCGSLCSTVDAPEISGVLLLMHAQFLKTLHLMYIDAAARGITRVDVVNTHTHTHRTQNTVFCRVHMLSSLWPGTAEKDFLVITLFSLIT